jgi:DNA repair protein SbcC/Rad50
MKPVVLEMQAFMPYGVRQVIDFRELGSQRLMMIAGETGAGKTAVLDAMAYGLFGASTGGGRTELSYRSHHAIDGTLTYVNFQFELQGHTYRAVRYPPQSGKSQGVYELWRLNEVDDPNGQLIASGKSKLNKEVQRLLGYSLSQFRSVVMLPQGQFREFLSAKTDKKAEILSSLFRTTRYQRLQDELYTRFKRLETQQADTRKQVDGILERAGVENESELATAIEALTLEINRTTSDVKSKADVTATHLKRHETALGLVEKFDQLNVAQEALTELEARADQRLAEEETLKRARQAAQVAPVEKNRSDRQMEVGVAQERTQRSIEAFKIAQATAKAAEKTLAAETDRDEGRAAIQTELVKLEGLKEGVLTLQRLVTEHRGLVKRVADEKTKRERAERSLNENKASFEHLTGTLAEQRIAAAELGSIRAQHGEIGLQLTRRRSVDDLTRRLAVAQQTEATAMERVGSATALTARAKETFERDYQAHLSAYAAQLADGLQDGAPCPVCGSDDHPAPATPGDDAPDKEAVERARAALKVAESDEKVAHESARSAQTNAEPVRAELSLLTQQLGEGLSVDMTALEATHHASAEALKDATAAQALIPQLEEQLTATQERSIALTQDMNHAVGSHENVERDLRAQEALVAAQQETVPEDLQTVQAVDDHISTQRATLHGMDQALEAARASVKTSGETVAEARTEEANALQALDIATKKSAEAEKTLIGRVANAGFADLDDYRSAKLAPTLCAELESKVKRYDEQVNQLRGQLKQLKAATDETTRPDIGALSEALASAQMREAESREVLAERQKTLSPKQQGLASIRELKSQSAGREAAFGLMATLAKTAQGNNAYKLKFERYVLAGLLDEVLIEASRRLKKMSNDRYTIRRTDPHRHGDKKVKIDRRSQAGLELEVVDAFTGRERDAHTLSGGEGFQASLALALGLADVIQTQAGGIELSAMFIDEGFGTQSAEALDSVLDTLVNLQSSGRLVGFISHVDGMKERISAKLIVHKTSTGSHASFAVT